MWNKLKKLRVNIGWKSILLIGVGIALLIVDLVTKIFEERQNWNFKVIPGLIEVEGGAIHRNPGCAFSFLADASWGQPFLIAMTFVLLIVLIAAFIFLPERFLILKITLAMIIAGAIGNLVDRISYFQVRDFVGVKMFGNMVYCNFADFWISFGTALAVLDIMFLNEFALIPLTKSAREAQKKKNEEKEGHKSTEVNDDLKPVETAEEPLSIDTKEDSNSDDTDKGGNE